MKCRDLMNLEPQWISSDATVAAAAKIMRDRAVGLLLVFDASPGILKGVITDRDLATRVCAEDKIAGQTRVIDVATTQVATCGENEDLRDAEAKMQELQRSRLVVIDGQGNPIGILGLSDVLRGDRGRNALKTARAVLAHEDQSVGPPPERIKLTPSTPEDEEAAAKQSSVMMGGSRDGSMKEFPS